MESNQDDRANHGTLDDEVLSLDLSAMTEEDARQAGIQFLSKHIEMTKSEARFSLVWDLIMTALFQDVVVDGTYANYRAEKKALSQFQKNTYTKGYIAFLSEWQDRIRAVRQLRARQEQRSQERRRKRDARRAAKEGQAGETDENPEGGA